MLPQLPISEALRPEYRSYLDSLRKEGFTGEVRLDYATRLVTATDNSVYQVLPQAVIYPRNQQDVELALRVLARPEFDSLHFSPRGGGTGTNGQSLCDGIVCDLSRDLREILELNADEGWVRVQPGVVLDQLNAYLAPHGYFFAPTVSPSNRATVGGMIATDASGKGSRIYGKTSKHLVELSVVLGDGTPWTSRPLDRAGFETVAARQDRVGEVHRQVSAICREHRETVLEVFPQMNRFMTGYNLAHVVDDDGEFFDLNPLIAGSEGTLALVTEAKVRILPLPKHRKLVALRYSDFDAALRSVQVLVESEPLAVETVDDTIVELAKGDLVWHEVAHLLEAEGEPPVRAFNLVEYVGDDESELEDKVQALATALDEHLGQPGQASGYTICKTAADMAGIWKLRKKGVGLLGNAKGARRPIAFIEDTAVPPQNLADYIAEVRGLLDERGLTYGMFGHVDVGCLHVRPALDMKAPADERQLREISDDVADIVKKHGGVMWGEHGTGYRSEYSALYFGPELDDAKRQLKAVFDPKNQLNPGKLATPSGSRDALVSVDAIKRGTFDRQIPAKALETYEKAVTCNGNGACFDWNPDSIMCPSSRVTKERVHSPKGRAGVMREWLRLAAQNGYDTTEFPTGQGLDGRQDSDDDFNHEVYDAMQGCLACKACATQCPIKVDVPSFRSRFLEHYHSRYRRPLKDYFVAGLEKIIVLMALWPALMNIFFRAVWFRALLQRFVGIVDSPAMSAQPFPRWARREGLLAANPGNLSRLNRADKQRSVILLQDAFTSFYEADVARSVVRTLQKLGFMVLVAPYFENGKALHIKGFVREFFSVARKNRQFLETVAASGVPIVGIDPAVTLTYHDEYLEAFGGEKPAYQVQLLQDWLLTVLRSRGKTVDRTLASTAAQGAEVATTSEASTYRFFGHCTERTASPLAASRWQEVFEAAGAHLEVEDVGCCGMCGAYGHDKTHVEESRGIFEMSWGKKLPMDQGEREKVVTTGHSCRSQTKRFAGFVPRHPCEVLAELPLDQALVVNERPASE